LQAPADIALIGLAVMGQNLVLNLNDHGYTVAVYNRTSSRTADFLAGAARGTRVLGSGSLADLVGHLKRPRKILIMVKAGQAVDDMLDQLAPLLEEGDILIDGGNSNYLDTQRRVAALEQEGLRFVGMGVSGGEEGARRGPSLMPGGSVTAWPEVRDMLRAIAARVPDGTPCCDWMGSGGAGHFVKMVHNGIEYGDMQLIAEAYDLMRHLAEMPPGGIAEVFQGWNLGRLDSYLVEITGHILQHPDADGEPLIDRILDAAGQKGTGKWTAMQALDLGVPLTLIAEAVCARSLSSRQAERAHASSILEGPGKPTVEVRREPFLVDLEQALFSSKIISYAQGYMLLQVADREYGWNLNLGGIALVWRAGCIIRSAFLDRIQEAFLEDPALQNLLLAPFFRDQIGPTQVGWRRVVARAVEAGIPVPAMASGLAFYDGYRRARLPANLIQAQRDYFGAHTYERVDHPRGRFFHTDWTGQGGGATAGIYSA